MKILCSAAIVGAGTRRWTIHLVAAALLLGILQAGRVEAQMYVGLTGVVWSFDNKYAAVGRLIAMPDRPDELPLQETYLCTGDLQPLERLHPSAPGMFPLCAAFSRDNRWIYYAVPGRKLDETSIMRRQLEGDRIPKRYITLKDDVVVCLLPGAASDEIIMQLGSSPMNLFRFFGSQKTRMLTYGSLEIKLLNPYLIDKAHRDCLKDNNLLLRVHSVAKPAGSRGSPRGPVPDALEIWHVPLTAKSLPADRLQKEPIHRLTYQTGADGRSSVSLSESLRTATIRLADSVNTVQAPHIPGGQYILDRRQAVWIEPSDKSLCMISSLTGRRVLLRTLPGKSPWLAGFNEDLGIIALQDRDAYYTVDAKTGTVQKYAYGDILDNLAKK